MSFWADDIAEVKAARRQQRPTSGDWESDVYNQAMEVYGDPEEALVATAQAALETGFGKSAPGGNLFGIKSHGRQGGGTYRTTEVVNGRPVSTTASFRSYDSPASSIADRGAFLQRNPRYTKAGYFDAGSAEEKAAALQRAGYATDPNYASKLQSLIQTFRERGMGGGPVFRRPESSSVDAEQVVADWHASISKSKPAKDQQEEPEESEESPSFNLARGAGERAATLASGVPEFVSDVGKALEQAVPLGGFTWEGWMPELRGPEEYAKYMADKTDWLQQGADWMKGTDLGYEPGTTWEDVKDSEGFFDFVGNALGFGSEQLFVSIPDMAAAYVALPAYVLARSGEISQARAEADDKENPDAGDLAVGTLAATVASFAERFGVDRLLKGLKGNTKGFTGDERKLLDAVKTVAKGVGKTGGTEAATEAFQEAIEYTATTLGTEAGFDKADLLDSMMAGAVGGGVGGGMVGSVGGVATEYRERAAVRDKQDNITTSQELDTIPETPEDEQAAVRAVTEDRKVAGMVLRPESVQAAVDAGLTVIEAPNGYLVTKPENEQVVREAEEAGERYRVLGYAEDKETALGPETVVVRPVDATGASPGAQIVSPEKVEEAQTLAAAQAGEGGTVEVIDIATEVERRAEAEGRLVVEREAAEAEAAAQEKAAEKAAKKAAKEAKKAAAEEEAMWAAVGKPAETEAKRKKREKEARKEEEAMWAAREEEERYWAEGTPPTERYNATPKAVDYAKREGIDLGDVKPEPNGKVTVSSVRKHAVAAKKAGRAQVISEEEMEERRAHKEDVESQKAAEKVELRHPPGKMSDEAIKEQWGEDFGGKLIEDARRVGKEAQKAHTPVVDAEAEGALVNQMSYMNEREKLRVAGSIAAGNRKRKNAYEAEEARDDGAVLLELARHFRKKVQGDKRIAGDDKKHVLAPANEAIKELTRGVSPTNPRKKGRKGILAQMRHLQESIDRLSEVQKVQDEEGGADVEARIQREKQKTAKPKSEGESEPKNKETQKTAKPKPEPKDKEKQIKEGVQKIRGYQALVNDGVLTEKQALAYMKQGVTPDVAYAEVTAMFEAGTTRLAADQHELFEEDSGIEVSREQRKVSKNPSDEQQSKPAGKPRETPIDGDAEAQAAASLEAAKKAEAVGAAVKVSRRKKRKIDIEAVRNAPVRNLTDRVSRDNEYFAGSRSKAARQMGRVIADVLKSVDRLDPDNPRGYRLSYILDEIVSARKLPKQHPYAQLARRLLKLIDDDQIQDPSFVIGGSSAIAWTIGPEFAQAQGFYSASGLIAINEERHSGWEDLAHTIFHEAVHSAVHDTLSRDNAAAKEIQGLAIHTFEHLVSKGHHTGDILGMYGFTNPDEFLAEAMTNPAFQRLLQETPAPAGAAGRIKDVWSMFVRAIARALGRDVDSDVVNVLDEVIRIFPELTQTPEEVYHARETTDRAFKGDIAPEALLLLPHKKGSLTPQALEPGGLYHDMANARRYRGVSPSSVQKVRDFFRPTKIAVTNVPRQRRWLGVMATDQILREYGGEFESGGAQEYNRWNQKRTAIARREQQKADALNNRWVAWEKRVGARKAEALNKLMRDTTLNQREPTQAEFNALGLDGQRIYQDVRTFFKEQRKAKKAALMDKLVSFSIKAPAIRQVLLNNLSGAQSAKDVDAAFKRLYNAEPALEGKIDSTVKLAKKVVRYAELKGPYFPLMRFGDYVVSGKRGEEEYVAFHESYEEAKEDMAARRREGYQFKSKTPTGREEWNQAGISALPVLASKLSKKAETPAVRDQIGRAMVELLADHSMRKSELHRKGTPGVKAAEMRRAVAMRAFAGSWELGDLQTAFQRSEALASMKADARQGSPEMMSVAQELEVRESKALGERTISKLDTKLSKFGFLWYLASPSYSVVNMTQPWVVTLPYLGSKYGAAKSAAALGKNMATMFRPAIQGMAEMARGRLGTVPDPRETWELMQEKLPPGAQQMLQDLQDRGIIDASFAQELYLSAAGEKATMADHAVWWSRLMPQTVEALNRVMTAAAAYELAPGNHEAKTEAAADAVYQTQFDYSDANKPRWFKMVPGARAIMMFKMYAQGIYALTIPAAYRAMKGDKQAMKLFGGIMATHTLAAGALGGILTEPVRALINITGLLFGWDDDDVEMAMEDALKHIFGEYLGQLAARGPLRALGVDFGSRIGLDTVMLMDTSGHAESGEEWYKNKLFALLGPVASAGQQMFKAGDYLKEEEYGKALEAGMPKLVKDIAKAWNQRYDGLSSRTGEVFVAGDEFSAWDSVVQAFGFSTTTRAEGWETRIRHMRPRADAIDAADLLRRRFVNATGPERIRMLRSEIPKHNRKYGGISRARLLPKNLWKSVRERAKREAQIRATGLRYYVDPKDLPYYMSQ